MKNILKFLSIFILIAAINSCDDEPVDTTINAEDIIPVNSNLYNLLERVADDEDPEGEITCIEFIYPVTLYVFNEDLDLLNSEFITSDQQFSDLLGSLDPTYAISVSYPITTTLADGTTFSINTNEELKEAIDNCIRDEAIGQCQQLIKNCIWKVGYLEGTENTYLGGVFQEDNGATTFSFDNNVYFGSWNVLFIENQLHININLNDESQIGSDMNFDWEVQYLDEDSILLTNEDKSMLLHQYCDTDYALCNNLKFEACELENSPGIAELILDDYTYCIQTILQIEAEDTSVTYFETYDDANSEVNPISSDQLYYNITPIQLIFVRIENIEDGTFYIIDIEITITSC